MIFIFLWCDMFRYYNNAYYAKIGGISTREMNFLEVDFLFGLSFHLNVTPATFQAYCVHLQREMLLMQPPLSLADSSLTLGKSLKSHLCFNEDESSHQNQQQLAVWFFLFCFPLHFLNACSMVCRCRSRFKKKKKKSVYFFFFLFYNFCILVSFITGLWLNYRLLYR